MNNLAKLLEPLNSENADLHDQGVGHSGMAHLADVQETLQRFFIDNSCIGGKDHDLMHVATMRCTCPGVEKVVRWCKVCGAVVIDRDIDGRTQPGGITAMQHPKLSVAVTNLTHIAL